MTQIRSKDNCLGPLVFQKVANPVKAVRQIPKAEDAREEPLDEEDYEIPVFAGEEPWPPRYPFEDLDDQVTTAEWLSRLQVACDGLQK